LTKSTQDFHCFNRKNAGAKTLTYEAVHTAIGQNTKAQTNSKEPNAIVAPRLKKCS